MKLNKIHVAILLMFSILSIEWTPRQPHAVTGNEKNTLVNGTGITFNYTTLKLTKEKYQQLIAKDGNSSNTGDRNESEQQKKNSIVFQFSYLSQTYPYPTLRAFPKTMHGQNIIFGKPRNLEYSVIRPLPDLSVCDEQVTGDLEITVYNMELLKQESNPADKEAYQYFVFTPKFDDSTQHVYFEINVFPRTSPGLLPPSRLLKPSPPY